MALTAFYDPHLDANKWFDPTNSAAGFLDITFDQSGGLAATLAADQGAFNVNGINAALNSSRSLGAALGTFTLAGIATQLPLGRIVAGGKGTFSVSGVAAGFPVALSMRPVTGAYTIAGNAANLTFVPGGVTVNVDWLIRARRRGRR